MMRDVVDDALYMYAPFMYTVGTGVLLIYCYTVYQRRVLFKSTTPCDFLAKLLYSCGCLTFLYIHVHSTLQCIRAKIDVGISFFRYYIIVNMEEPKE